MIMKNTDPGDSSAGDNKPYPGLGLSQSVADWRFVPLAAVPGFLRIDETEPAVRTPHFQQCRSKADLPAFSETLYFG